MSPSGGTKWPKPAEKISKLTIIRMLFKSRDEKKIFGIMNFQKKSRNSLHHFLN
jgi:hypothetical protein